MTDISIKPFSDNEETENARCDIAMADINIKPISENEENEDAGGNIVVTDINIKPVPDESLPCDACIKCMIDERHHLDHKVNDSATVVIQSPEKFLLDNAPTLNSLAKMMKDITTLNPHL